MKQQQAPCSVCKHDTLHELVYSLKTKKDPLDEDFRWLDEHYKHDVLRCCSCNMLHIRESSKASHQKSYEVISYFPPSVEYAIPGWMLTMFEDASNPEFLNYMMFLHSSLLEVYTSANNGQSWLATMGIRAIVEQVLEKLVGPTYKSFESKLNASCELGYISVVQRDMLSKIIEAGHASIHRTYKPSREDMRTLLSITEHFLASLYHHPGLADKISGQIEEFAPRPRRPPKREPI